MKLNSRQRLIAILGLVVLASGCTQTGGNTSSVSITPNTGVTVERFEAFPSNVPESQSVQLETTLRNTGGQEATNVKMDLFNIPFEGAQNWGGDQSVGGDGTTLRPADQDANVPASPRTFTFALDAPDLSTDTTQPYTIFGELSYDYTTVATSEMVLMSQDRYRETGASRSKPSVQNTGGPITMEIRTRSPIVYYGEDSQTRTNPQFCVVVRNSGQGTPSTDGEGDDTVTINARTSGNVNLDVPEGGGSEQTVDLVGSRGVGCYDIDTPDTFSSNQLTLPLTITADYTYSKETSTTVNVEGRAGSSSN